MISASPRASACTASSWSSGQLVEAVQEDRRATPAAGLLEQRIEHTRGAQWLVVAPQRGQPVAVAAVQRTELACVGLACRLGSRPLAQRDDEPARVDALFLELARQLDQRPRETEPARRVARRGELAQLAAVDRRRRDPFAFQPTERAPVDTAAPRDLVDQPAEAQDLHAEHRATGGQLAAVVIDVGERRDDE